MANPEHLAILKRGVEVWNEWREDHPETRPDLAVSIHGPYVGGDPRMRTCARRTSVVPS